MKFLSLILVTFLSINLSANEYSNFIVHTIHLKKKVETGKSGFLEFEIENTSKKKDLTFILSLYPLSTTETGSLNFNKMKKREKESRDFTQFVKEKDYEFTIKKGQKIKKKVAYQIPKEADGSFYFLYRVLPKVSLTKNGVQMIQRKVVESTGKIDTNKIVFNEEFDVTVKNKANFSKLSVEFRNTGNTHLLQTKAEIILVKEGKVLFKEEAIVSGNHTVYPGNKVYYNLKTKNKLKGKYNLILSVSSTNGYFKNLTKEIEVKD
tara:strand:- start:6004 stop:6795 length:792 start_codon:yes stop_codon:yes gene_type:complete